MDIYIILGPSNEIIAVSPLHLVSLPFLSTNEYNIYNNTLLFLTFNIRLVKKITFIIQVHVNLNYYNITAIFFCREVHRLRAQQCYIVYIISKQLQVS